MWLTREPSGKDHFGQALAFKTRAITVSAVAELNSWAGRTRELHTRLLRPRLNFSSQLCEARRAMKKMAASPMIAMTLIASSISSTASTIESTMARAVLITARHDAAGTVNEGFTYSGPASGRWKNPN